MVESLFHWHSFVEIVHEHITLFIDPFITWNKQCDISVKDAIAKKPSAIIITHGHDDHIGDTIEIAQATWCVVIATYEVCNWLVSQWISNTSAHWIGGFASYEWYGVKFTPATHWWDITWTDITWVAAWVLVSIAWKTLYHAWDTWLTMEFELLGRFETIDCAFLPIGDRYTMWVQDAIRATQMLSPRYVVPIHFNTWDPIKVDPMEFAREVLLWNFSVPKVLNPWQMLVLE